MTDLLSTAREATSDRITLGVTAVLTLSAISLDSRSDLPKVMLGMIIFYDRWL